jgi:hypothetical protein
MKIFGSILLVIATGFLLNVQAQTHLGLNTIYSKPLGKFGREAMHGYGGNVNAKFFVGPKVTLGLSTGYLGYGTANSRVGYNIAPLTLESEFYFREQGLRPYLAFSGGMLLLTRKEKYKLGTRSISELYFTFSPMAGVLFDLSNSAALRFNMQYLLFFVDNETWYALTPSLGIYYKIGE